MEGSDLDLLPITMNATVPMYYLPVSYVLIMDISLLYLYFSSTGYEFTGLLLLSMMAISGNYLPKDNHSCFYHCEWYLRLYFVPYLNVLGLGVLLVARPLLVVHISSYYLYSITTVWILNVPKDSLSTFWPSRSVVSCLQWIIQDTTSSSPTVNTS